MANADEEVPFSLEMLFFSAQMNMYTIMGYLNHFIQRKSYIFVVIKVNIKDISASLMFLISVSTLIYN